MSEFTQASRLWSGGLGLHLLPNPAKTWSFSGPVPAVIAYTNDDGTEPTEEQLRKVVQFGPRIAGVKTRVFVTREDGVKAAEALGVSLCSSPTCACAKYAQSV